MRAVRIAPTTGIDDERNRGRPPAVKVVTIGTGAARGWPIVWCRCASCAAMRRESTIRGQTCVLVDDRLLLDLGGTALLTPSLSGMDLGSVRHLLVGHSHSDHWSPRMLRYRRDAGVAEPLEVVGPPAVVADVEELSDPAITGRSVVAGDRLRAGRYDVAVHAARHYGDRVGPAVLYDIRGPDGARMLYATDTGPLPERTIRDVRGAAFDLVLLDETYGLVPESDNHHDLDSFRRDVERLRRVGAVGDRTRVAAIHLGHGNPPTDQLRQALASVPAVPARDGDTFLLAGG